MLTPNAGVGTIRRECLDRLLIVNEHHLARVIEQYVEHYVEHYKHPPTASVPGTTPTRPHRHSCVIVDRAV